MDIRRLALKIPAPEGWRVSKKMKPGQRGAIKLARAYDQDLVCVRYRESPDGTERITTIELVVERAIIQKRDDPVVAFKIKHDELALRRAAQAKGARYDAKTAMWKLQLSEVIRMGLRNRIAITAAEIHQE